MIYLDYNATTPLREEVWQAMEPLLREHFGNPSSFYRCGRTARAAVQQARASIAAGLNAAPGEIVFTGSGTESDNLALRGLAHARRARGKHIITSRIEHHAVLHTCDDLEREGFTVTRLPVDERGLVDPDELAAHIGAQTILISIMHANNETGVIQPVEAIGQIAREHGIALHVDAVQSAGKLALDVKRLQATALTIAAHKFYGPKGVGVLYLEAGTPIDQVISGGAQEGGLRPGTENVAGIVGCATAFELARQNLPLSDITALRDHFETQLRARIPDISINGAAAPRVPNTSNVSFHGVEGESLLLHLDLQGICAASGSACTTGDSSPSHVLLAMGLEPRQVQGSLRFSLGHFTTPDEIDTTIEALARATERLRSISSLPAQKH